jgi:cytoplasmic iron level regulating protein YaaA (DUF328/UPF0246 family)
MLIVISPSKSINFETPSTRKDATSPRFEREAGQLMSLLSVFRADEIAAKEKVSIRIALSAYEYIQTFAAGIRKEAVFAYSGNVYDKLRAESLSEEALRYVQEHVCIFSALYGLLRPLDVIKPYRLDMHSGLIRDLYAFWREKVTQTLANRLEANDYLLVNLASAEYFGMIDQKLLPRQTRIITPVFQQERNGRLTVNSLFAKQARGWMLRFLAENRLSDPCDMQAFDAAGYFFDPLLSGRDEWRFTK